MGSGMSMPGRPGLMLLVVQITTGVRCPVRQQLPKFNCAGMLNQPAGHSDTARVAQDCIDRILEEAGFSDPVQRYTGHIRENCAPLLAS